MQSARAYRQYVLRIYRRCLRLYPASFREDYGRELCLTFLDRWRAEKSFGGAVLLCVDALLGIVREAPREHFAILQQDLRLARRTLRESLSVTTAAILILSLGIAAATLVFSLANAFLFQPMPYADADRLVLISEEPPGRAAGNGISLANANDLAARTQLLEGMGVLSQRTAAVPMPGRPAELFEATAVSNSVLPTLGVSPILGRMFTMEENVPGGRRLTVLSERLWARRFGRDPGIIGKDIDFDIGTYTVIGIMPASFYFPVRSEAWGCLRDDPEKTPRTAYAFSSIARLRPGVTVEKATAELERLLGEIHRQHPESDDGSHMRVIRLREFEIAPYRNLLITLVSAGGLLLLITCVNVGNLLMVKASVREREMAVRIAIGASRRRLVRQILTECLLFSAAAGLLGDLLALIAWPAVTSLVPAGAPLWINLAPDYRVWIVSSALILATGLICALPPILGLYGMDLPRSLKVGGRCAVGTAQGMLRNRMVIAEVVLSVILLSGAGLTLRSLAALYSQRLGFQPESTLLLSLAYGGIDDRSGLRQLTQTLAAQVESIPGVESAAFSNLPPLGSGAGAKYLDAHASSGPTAIHELDVTPEYFRTLKIPLLEGRNFTEDDYDDSSIVIVTQAFARDHFLGVSPLGQRIQTVGLDRNARWSTIIGVVQDSKQEPLRESAHGAVFRPYNSLVAPNILLMRITGDPSPIVVQVQQRVARLNPRIAIIRTFTGDDVMARQTWSDRLTAILIGSFGGLAVVLATVGVYAVISFAIATRTQEIAIRMALGAPAAQIQRTWTLEGCRLAFAGLVIGLVGSLILAQFLKSALFEVSPFDPLTYVSVSVVLLAIAAVASFIPARRATLIDPATVLHSDM